MTDMNHGSGNSGGGPPSAPPGRRGGGTVRQFPWNQLDKLGSEQVEAANRLLSMLPLGKAGEDLLEALGAKLGELVGADHNVYFHDLAVHAPSSKPGAALEFGDGFATRFHMPPDPEVGALVVEMNLVEEWLGALRDRPTTARRMGALSARDFGLATYLLLRVLRWLGERGAPPVVFPLEAPDPSTLQKNLGRSGAVVEVAYVVSTDTSTGLARLFFPLQLIRNLEVFADGEATRRRARRSLMEGSLSELSVHLPVSLANLTLKRVDFASLRPGDVLLPAEHGFEDPVISPPADGARLYLREGSERHYLRCRVAPAQGGWQITVDDTTEYTETRDATMSDDNASGGSTQLLESPEMDVDILVGQLTLTLRELGNLQSGQILKLDKRVGETVQLRVDGRIIGEGELVNVEGELGVRVRRMKK